MIIQHLLKGQLMFSFRKKTSKLLDIAGNGAELIQLLANKKPDIILIDINMPVMNGIDALREIKTKVPRNQVDCFFAI